MNYLAIDVGGTFTKYAVITDQCRIIRKEKRPTVLEPLEDFLDSLVYIYKETTQKEEIAGLALSMPGMMDSKRGFMYTGGNIRCIDNLNIVEIMEKRCRIPVTVENDAKCAALAELWQGALKDVKNAIVMVCGTGVGGAVIQDREVINGKHFIAGEFSYIMTESDGAYELKNSLAETAGIKALIRFVSEETGIPETELDGEKIFSMANDGNENACCGIRKYAKHLAVQIHNCHFTFDPERIAIGGGVSAQPLLIRMIREELEKLNGIYPWTLPVPEVVPCRFFNDANLIGAVYVHLRSREKRVSLEKTKELLKLLEGRREGEYLRELIME